MTQLNLSKEAQKQLAALPKKQQQIIAAKLRQVQQNPLLSGSRRLKGRLADYRRVRAGDFRIIYFIEADIVKVVIIGKRNDGKVYRRAGRKS